MIGSPERFAVEYRLNEQRGGAWLFGKACFWIAGARIGDFEMGTSLRDFLFQIEGGRRDHGRRQNRRFDAMPARVVFETLESALFGPSSPELDALSVQEEWARHRLKPDIDIFDHWKVYLVESTESARLIYRFNAGEIKECVLSPGECDQVLKTACVELAALYDEEVARNTRPA